jgi:hypothetical protein
MVLYTDDTSLWEFAVSHPIRLCVSTKTSRVVALHNLRTDGGAPIDRLKQL